MKQTNFFNISVPELGDRPDITQVSNAISNLEDALAGTMEYMNASVNNKVLTLTSATRKTKRTGYHTGLTCVFTSGVKIDIGGITSVIVDNLPARPAELKFIIDADDSAIVVFDGTKFAFKHAPMPRSNAIDSSSEHFIATSRAVKTLNDNKAEKTVQVIAGNGLTGGGDLTSNKTINVVSADAGIIVNADNIKLNIVDTVNSSDTIRPASANAVKFAYEKALEGLNKANEAVSLANSNNTAMDNKKVNRSGDTMTGRLIAKELQISGTEPGLMNSVGGNLIRNSSSDANITVVGNIKGKTIIDSVSNPTVRINSATTEQTIYHTGNKPSKADVGLGSVSDFPVTSSVSDSSNSKYATAGAVKTAYDRASSALTEADKKANRAGDTMTGALKFTTAATSSDTTAPGQIGYGLMSSYGTLKILANTDNSTTDEPVIIASAKGLTTNKNDGLAVGKDYLKWLGNDIYHTGNKPSKADVGLSSVPNYPATSSVSDTSNEKFATAGAVKQAYDRASSGINEANTKVSKAGDTMTGTLSVPALELMNSATPYVDFTRGSENIDFHHRIISMGSGRLEFRGISGNQYYWFEGSSQFTGTATATKFLGPLQGNADTSTKLSTARQINGTNFDGTANITTANWGTARNITIGNTAKSVNGSGNVGWSIAEIGAVNKAGDVLAGGLRTATIGHGFALTFESTTGAPASNTTGIFSGKDCGATLNNTNNIDIKSWYGTSFSPSEGLPTISFNNRNGDAKFNGVIRSKNFVLEQTPSNVYISEATSLNLAQYGRAVCVVTGRMRTNDTAYGERTTPFSFVWFNGFPQTQTITSSGSSWSHGSSILVNPNGTVTVNAGRGSTVLYSIMITCIL